jgi:hypothetical protein
MSEFYGYSNTLVVSIMNSVTTAWSLPNAIISPLL